MSRSSEKERGLRAFAWALAFVGFISVAFPTADLLLTNLPWELGRVDWRYQFIGRLSQMIITPIIGLTFVLGAGLLTRSATTARVSGILAYLAAGVVLALTLLFVVDGTEARTLVPPEAQSVFRIGGLRAISKNVFSVGALGLIGWASFRGARSFRSRRSEEREDPTLLG